ncbi:hypothetical protein AB0B45_31340 [Nonomuraea sp. NPDC049152]|uniref:hypothetical protein n=1 Tax=Nonomuraea sp. NPDC049152 TaxID=3154350 RepID=UPI0033D84CE3
MRAAFIGLLTAGLLASPAAASAQSAPLPSCDGVRILHTPVRIQSGDTAAYVHVFYDSRTAVACAYLDSSNQTWGYSKHMTIQLKHCQRPSSTRGVCNGQLQSTAVGGWSSGRSDKVTLRITDGYIMGVGRIWWNDNYGINQSRAIARVSSARVAQRDVEEATREATEATR